MQDIGDFYELTQEQIKNLNEYVKFLLYYNNKINLIGKSTIDDIWNRHILDSLQIIKIINDKNVRLADLGSGAGLPGIPLSIIGIKEVHLYEKSPRKCEFLDLAKKFSNNKIIIHNENINEVKDGTYDIITSRALGSLNLLLSFSKKFKTNHTELIFLKGKKIFEEIEEAKKYWMFDYQLIDSVTSTEGKIIKILNFKRL